MIFACLAVSQTPDPTGPYFTYRFHIDAAFRSILNNQSYGVWPDAYYMASDHYPIAGPGASSPSLVYAFDRARMLVGESSGSIVSNGTMVVRLGADVRGLVPSTVNGLTPPPAGTPNYFTALGTDALHVFAFHVDWASPASSTFTELPGSPVAVAPFDSRVPSGQTGPIEQPPPADSSEYLTAAVRSVDGDAKADLVWRNPSSGFNRLWYLDGTARELTMEIMGVDWDIHSVADFTGDGRVDIVWRNKMTGEDVMWTGIREWSPGLTVKTATMLPRIADLNWKIVGPR